MSSEQDPLSTFSVHDWKDRSERGEVCGMLGCTGKPDVKCTWGCANNYCEPHSKLHMHPAEGSPRELGATARAAMKSGEDMMSHLAEADRLRKTVETAEGEDVEPAVAAWKSFMEGRHADYKVRPYDILIMRVLGRIGQYKYGDKHDDEKRELAIWLLGEAARYQFSRAGEFCRLTMAATIAQRENATAAAEILCAAQSLKGFHRASEESGLKRPLGLDADVDPELLVAANLVDLDVSEVGADHELRQRVIRAQIARLIGSVRDATAAHVMASRGTPDADYNDGGDDLEDDGDEVEEDWEPEPDEPDDEDVAPA